MVKRITPNIRSGNPAVGQEFYTDILGLEVVTDMGWVVTLASPENPTAQLTIVEYPAQVRTRKSLGEMIRKLSVT